MSTNDGDDDMTTRPTASLDSPTSSNDAAEENGGVRIPQAKDGFFGYNDEKNLQHVRDSAILTSHQL
jgi:hypothetical protein